MYKNSRDPCIPMTLLFSSIQNHHEHTILYHDVKCKLCTTLTVNFFSFFSLTAILLYRKSRMHKQSEVMVKYIHRDTRVNYNFLRIIVETIRIVFIARLLLLFVFDTKNTSSMMCGFYQSEKNCTCKQKIRIGCHRASSRKFFGTFFFFFFFRVVKTNVYLFVWPSHVRVAAVSDRWRFATKLSR